MGGVVVNSVGPGPVSLQRRVQFAVLLQFAEHGIADRATTAVIVPGTGARDLELALESLIDEGSIDGPVSPRETLAEAAGTGWLALTALGRLRLDEDDV
jgi:hypothetical protein